MDLEDLRYLTDRQEPPGGCPVPEVGIWKDAVRKGRHGEATLAATA